MDKQNAVEVQEPDEPQGASGVVAPDAPGAAEVERSGGIPESLSQAGFSTGTVLGLAPDDGDLSESDIRISIEVEAPVYTPAEKIQNLVKGIPGRKNLLMGIMEFCREGKTPQEVDEETARLQESDYSLYSAVSLRELLEEAEALVYLLPESDDPTAEGSAPSAEDAGAAASGPVEPEEEFLEVTVQPSGLWTTTQHGIAYLENNNPLGELMALLAEDAQTEAVCLEILRFCAEDGRSKPALDELVSRITASSGGVRHSLFYITKLEDSGALVWKNCWVTSDAVRSILASQ